MINACASALIYDDEDLDVCYEDIELAIKKVATPRNLVWAIAMQTLEHKGKYAVGIWFRLKKQLRGTAGRFR